MRNPAKKLNPMDKTGLLLTIPFFALCLAFLVLPLSAIVVASFSRGLDSTLSILSKPAYVKSLLNSLYLSALVTLQASLFGGALALMWSKRINQKNWFLSILNFASNNGGITLAFAMIATVGASGFLTLLLKNFNIQLYPDFNLVSMMGLNLAYLSFLVPYMALLFLPAVSCLKKHWWEAAQTLGSNKLRYWIKVAIPVLLPSFIASACLIFLTALGTYATAYAISENSVDLITIRIGKLLQSSVLKMADAYTLSFLLVCLMFVVVMFYRKANMKASRWLK